MFVNLEKIAQTDPKYVDIFLLENYAAFQNRYVFSFLGNFIITIHHLGEANDQKAMNCSLYDLANVVPTLAKFYHQASEAYEQACTRHISMIIYGVRDASSYLSISLLSWEPSIADAFYLLFMTLFHIEFVCCSNLKDSSHLLVELRI